MYEIKDSTGKVNSLALFVGMGRCNANCAHCAGKIHRKYSPKRDGTIDQELIYKTLKGCYEKGARRLSMSSGGEPTLSPLAVTKTLELIYECKKEGIEYSDIHLYSNGIRIGNDKTFCDSYLPLWKRYGLEKIYVTVHNVDEKRNAEIYGIKSYPKLEIVLSRIHKANLLMRANIVLSKSNIGTYERFVSIASSLKNLGVDAISAWPVRNIEDKVDVEYSPSETELDKMSEWIEKNQDPKCKLTLLREKDRIVYERGGKLTLFPDGTLSNTWCS